MQGGHIWLDWVVKQLITEPFAKSSTDIRPLSKNFCFNNWMTVLDLLCCPYPTDVASMHYVPSLGLESSKQSINQSVSQSVSQSIDQNMCFKVLRGNWDPTHNWSDACSHSM